MRVLFGPCSTRSGIDRLTLTAVLNPITVRISGMITRRHDSNGIRVPSRTWLLIDRAPTRSRSEIWGHEIWGQILYRALPSTAPTLCHRAHGPHLTSVCHVTGAANTSARIRPAFSTRSDAMR
jgi:hypothetical protein